MFQHSAGSFKITTMEENLNLFDNRLILLLKALNRTNNKEAAGKLLGISERTVWKMIKDHNIIKPFQEPYKINDHDCNTFNKKSHHQQN